MCPTITLLAATVLASPALAQSAGGGGAQPNQVPAARSISPKRVSKILGSLLALGGLIDLADA